MALSDSIATRTEEFIEATLARTGATAIGGDAEVTGDIEAAGDLIAVAYTSNTITNTPTLNAYVEIEC